MKLQKMSSVRFLTALFLQILPVTLLAFIVGLTSVTPAAAAMTGNHLVNIVGLPGGGTQSLPTSYVQSFPRWQVKDDDDDNNTLVMDATGPTPTVNLRLDWSATLKVRPALEFLLKSGIPTYIMAGLHLQQGTSSPSSSSSSSNSIPLARQWTTFGFAVEPNFRIKVFQHADDPVAAAAAAASDSSGEQQQKEAGNKDDTSDATSAESSVVAWKFENDQPAAKQVQEALELLGVALSQLEDDESELLQGFHIVSIPLDAAWKAVPQPTTASSYRISCLATAEPDAEALLTIEQDLLEMTASSILEMTVVSSAAGESNGDDEL